MMGEKKNMKKKLPMRAVLMLSLGLPGICVIAGPGGATGADNAPNGKRRGQLIRLLTVKDEAKVDALLAKAKGEGKITDPQAVNIKRIWTNHHAQFRPGSPVMRLLQAQDVIKVKAALDKAVSNKRITQQQADRAMDLWQKLHNEYLIK
jgi:hypothetical protein